MAVLWGVYAGILSVERGITCEALFGSESNCQDQNGYSEATTAVVKYTLRSFE